MKGDATQTTDQYSQKLDYDYGRAGTTFINSSNGVTNDPFYAIKAITDLVLASFSGNSNLANTSVLVGETIPAGTLIHCFGARTLTVTSGIGEVFHEPTVSP